MQTSFTLAQLADPQTAESEKILRACVHCGFCTATCPTYVLLGDELDSPRGRIYLMKEMLEQERPATADVVKHIDRCLSCLACMTTCPSGVHYMHLIDHGRAHVERTYTRPLIDRLTRALLAAVLPHPRRFRLALLAARLAKPLAPLLDAFGLKSLATMLRLAPMQLPPAPRLAARQVYAVKGPRRGRVAMLAGCANQVLAPHINEAAIRVLNRHGVEVVVTAPNGCCGALVHHMGREHESHAQARGMIDAWMREMDGEGLDAIVITASGCGTNVKDYGFMFRTDPAYANKAARVSELTRDITEYLADLGVSTPGREIGLVVAYHAACSLQHGQKVLQAPKSLLRNAGFTVKEVPEGHLCCGSAGTYNMLQPEIAARLGDRKVANIAKTAPDVIATGNLGCMVQIGQATAIPIVHTVELIDWATGGPRPQALKNVVERVIPSASLAAVS
jgi:glycolate oxidase iron-sulfur subunit